MQASAKRPPSSVISRVVFGAFIVISAIFIGSIIAQVVPVVFGAEDDAANGAALRAAVHAEAPHVGQACGAGIKALSLGIEAAMSRASQERGREGAKSTYDAAKSEVWNAYPEVARACEADPHGPDAIAALLRFERVAAGIAVQKADRLGRVRHEVDSFIR